VVRLASLALLEPEEQTVALLLGLLVPLVLELVLQVQAVQLLEPEVKLVQVLAE
jgi:hypothetical protein